MPKIIEITIGLATTFNNPFESYSNFKPAVQLKAIVGDGEDINRVALDLQAKCGELLATERHRILDGLKRENDIDSARRDVANYEHQLKCLDEVIANHPTRLADAAWRQGMEAYLVARVESQLASAREEHPRISAALAEAKAKLATLIQS